MLTQAIRFEFCWRLFAGKPHIAKCRSFPVRCSTIDDPQFPCMAADRQLVSARRRLQRNWPTLASTQCGWLRPRSRERTLWKSSASSQILPKWNEYGHAFAVKWNEHNSNPQSAHSSTRECAECALFRTFVKNTLTRLVATSNDLSKIFINNPLRDAKPVGY